MGNELKNYINKKYLSFICGERIMQKRKTNFSGNQSQRRDSQSSSRNNWFMPIVILISFSVIAIAFFSVGRTGDLAGQAITVRGNDAVLDRKSVV